MKNSRDISSITENLIKNSNESSFLPNKEKVKFHSIIILELFNFEDFPNLIKGLKELYDELNKSEIILFKDIDYSRIEDIIKDLKNPVESTWRWYNLPPIFNSTSSSPFGVTYDLGINIDRIGIGLYKISSSLVTMQINVKLKSTISDNLNKIIYKKYEEDEVISRYPDGRRKSMTLPVGLKSREINDFRLKLKMEIIDFLSSFFKGQLFKLCGNDYSIVPSIDLYSLNYPENIEDILKWGEEVHGFLDCFGISVNEFSSFKYNENLLCEEHKFKYPNYIILINRRLLNRSDEETINLFDYKSFVILALHRLTYIHNNILGELNATISNEIQNLEKNELIDVLENRKIISQKIYDFQRFKIEFELLKAEYILDLPFVSMAANKKDRYFLFDYIIEQLKKHTIDIDNAINTLNQHSDLTLNLTNIDYSRKNQILTNRLTWIVVVLTILQVVLVIITFFKQ